MAGKVRGKGGGILGGLKDLAVKTGVLVAENGDEAPSTSTASPPTTPSLTSLGPTMPGTVDSTTLEKLRVDVDRAATPAYHAFVEKLKSLSAVPGMTPVQCIAAAIATCGFPKDQILKGVEARSAELDRITGNFARDVETARTKDLGAADAAIKQIDDQLSARRKATDEQVAGLQKQIDTIKAAFDAEVGSMTADKATKQSNKIALEQRLNEQVANFSATSSQLRNELAVQSAQYTAALSA